ncbi:MAG: acyltransferase [Bacteroidota bacterium]|nr:acyltransferase [Bacteroidota bacterium]
MNPTTPTRSYYPALDGLRGMAILLVIACHNLNFIPGFEFGWIGVDLFFVLSGFLITDILLSTKASKNFLQNFYIRRILRIFPLYYGVLLVFFILAPAFRYLDVQYNYYHSHQVMSWFHLQNWLYIFNRKPNDFLLMNHFWSLSLEEQFYLVWPLVIFAVKGTRQLSQIVYGILGACIIGRFASWLYFGDGYTNFYFQYMTRVDGLCVGSLVAIWRFSSNEQAGRKVIRLALLLLGIHLFVFILAKTAIANMPHFSFFGYSSIAAILGVIIFFAVKKRNMFSKALLENPVLRYFGRISYGLYVYHWPILILAKLYFLDKLLNNGFSYTSGIMTVSLGAFAVALLTATASYYLFEKKILLLKDIMTEEGFFEKVRKKLLLLIYPASAE